MMKASGSRRAALVWGLVAALVYLASAFASGRISVLARRPLLDAGQPPPAYRFVKPPPDAITKDKPASGSFSIDLNASVLGAGVWATQDQQATLVTEPGTFPPGATGPIKLTITPLDPAQFGGAPKGMHIAGNVYRFAATSATAGPAEPFLNPAHLVLSYPALTSQVFSAKHTLLTSVSGRSWSKIAGNDSPANQQASADVVKLGLFAVGETGSRDDETGANPGVIVAAVAGGLAVVAGLAQYFRVRQRAARRKRARAKKGGKKRR